MLKKLITISSVFLALLLPIDAFAFKTEQVTTTTMSSHADVNAAKEPSSISFWGFLVGQTPQNAVDFALLAWHFNPESRKKARWNNLSLAATYNSVFIGTLLNSYDDRAFVLGVQRNVWETDSKVSDWNMSVGYRLGFITGYDQRMSGAFARYSPVLPFLQIYMQFAYKNFGIEFGWTALVLTAQLVYNF